MKILLSGVTFCLLAISPFVIEVSSSQQPLYFVDSAAKAGLTSTNTFGGIEKKRYLLETTGCGVAFVDYDRDGLVDLFFVNGRRFDNPSHPAPTSHLYRNIGSGSFTDVTEKAGMTYSGWGQG